MNVMCLYLQVRSIVPVPFTHQDLHTAHLFFFSSMNYPVCFSSAWKMQFTTTTHCHNLNSVELLRWHGKCNCSASNTEIQGNMYAISSSSSSYLLLNKGRFRLGRRHRPLMMCIALIAQFCFVSQLRNILETGTGLQLVTCLFFQMTYEMLLSLDSSKSFAFRVVVATSICSCYHGL